MAKFQYIVSGDTLDEAKAGLSALLAALSGSVASSDVPTSPGGKPIAALSGAKAGSGPSGQKTIKEKADERAAAKEAAAADTKDVSTSETTAATDTAPDLKADDVRAAVLVYAKAVAVAGGDPATVKPRAAEVYKIFKTADGKIVAKFDDLQPKDYAAALERVAELAAAEAAPSDGDI